MSRVLITAFEPYQQFEENASWLALVELTRTLPAEPVVTTRRYPVDFDQVKLRLAEDLAENYDYALHLGQAPGRPCIDFEAIAINVRGGDGKQASGYGPLCDDGPVAYRSDLPLAHWVATLAAEGVPARVSHHAGTYVCNAILYWSNFYIEQLGLRTRATFIHLPLDVSQTANSLNPGASLPVNISAAAIRRVLKEIANA